MANIKIYGDLDSGSIFFINSTVDPKSLGTIVASLIDVNGNDRILIERNDRFQEDGVSFRVLFKKLNANRVCNQAGEELISQLSYTTQQVVDYINGQSQLTGANGGDGNGTDVTGTAIDFKLDDTNTSIMLDNGFAYGVNTIKALANADGTIHIVSELGDLTYFTKLDYTNVLINGVSAVGGLSDVVNALNELFQVGAFEQVVIRDPYATMIADVDGIDTNITLGGNAINPSGNDIAGSTASGYNNSGILSTETINQAGEYFSFDIRGEGTIGFGLVHTDINNVNGSTAYGDPATWLNGVNSGHYGYQFSHWFHPSPNGSWTNYGANTGYSMRSGWSGFPNRQNWLDGNPIKMRVGIDSNGYISIESYDPSTSLFVPHARTSYPVADGIEFKLGIKFGDTNARLYSLPKIHTLEDPAPTMYFRYIESPDGNYESPLFATQEEANYYDLNHSGTVGTGTSHTHTYVDDVTNTTWYMADTGSTMTGTTIPASFTFKGNAATYTEITSQTNADLTPSQFSSSDLMYVEGTVVNLQLFPTGATFTQSVTITPTGSGLVYNSVSGYLQGTLTDVPSDTDYVIEVTRANAYGSTIGNFTITATDVPVSSTSTTDWDKAIDFSGSSEYLKHNASYATATQNPLALSNGTYITKNSNPLYTANSTSSRPFATTVVFKADGNNSLQTIWNNGEGFYSSQDNFGLEIDANNNLYFYWSNGTSTTSSSNRCVVQLSIDTSKWYGVYIAHKGGRLSGSNATSSNIGECFDIRVMSSADNFSTLSVDKSGSWSGGNWTTTGRRMDKSVNGVLTLGGTSAGTKSFYGKIAAFTMTTLKNNSLAPDATEIEMMITDPLKWEDDYKQGTTYRLSNVNSTASVPSAVTVDYNYATQIHLMGDSVGIYPYSHSDAYPNIFNNLRWVTATRMVMQNMVSNDIENVSISGLS